MLTPAADAATNTGRAHAPKRSSPADLGTKDIFLKLLVAEMQFQDPLNPQDPTRMSSQLAQFNTLEQQIKTNRLLADFLNRKGGARDAGALAGASLLGRQALARTDAIAFDGTRPADFEVRAPGASGVQVTIEDAAGRPVRTLRLAAPGSGRIRWDGATDTGATAPPGIYRVVVQARDAQGGDIPAEVRVRGLVDGVRTAKDGHAQFRVAGVYVPDRAILEITL